MHVCAYVNVLFVCVCAHCVCASMCVCACMCMPAHGTFHRIFISQKTSQYLLIFIVFLSSSIFSP